MVHYNPSHRHTPQHAPPLCPKCGSHRTVIVGMSQDLKATLLRCGACGERSELHPRDAVTRLTAR